MKKKIIKTSTVPTSLDTFCEGQLRMLSEHFEVVAVSSPGVEMERIRQREGVRTIAVSMQRHISVLKDIVSLFRMICVFRREHPYMVHSITPKAGLISMLAAWVCQVPVRIHTYTGLVFPTETGLKQKILIWMDRLLCASATYINPEGQGVANDLRRFHITKKPLHIIGHGNVRGINADHWKNEGYNRKELRRQWGVVEEGFVFLFVGRLVGDKGINELVEAFVVLQNKTVRTLQLLLVGNFEDDLDPLDAKTRAIIEENNDIIATGNQDDVRPFYAMSDCFVFPSYREGFPNTPLEAGAMGLPSIVTNINGANEIIVDGQNGLIIPPKDGEALQQTMQRMVSENGLCQQLSVHAREMVISRYEQQYLWNELLKVYKSF